MALSTQARDALPDSAFAGPGRTYPMENRAHAMAAVMDSHAGTPLHAKIVARAKREYGIGCPQCKAGK